MNHAKLPQQFKCHNKKLGRACQVFCFLFLLTLFIPSFSFAASSFSFSTEPQSVGVGELSGAITVHSETDVLETTYILLSSNSSSGQFFSSKTSSEPISSGSYIYISTGNTNRTFYYKDSSSGGFTITAEIYNKAKTDKLATLIQNISIGSSGSGGGTENASSTQSTSKSSGDTDTPASNSSSNYSAHSSPAPLSETENKIDFDISAGRDRLTSVGNNNVFVVNPTKLQNVSANNIRYDWSFGDGSVSQGSSVSHAYRFSGDYSVVVNAYYSDKQAVSRLLVKVVEPKISIERVSGGFSIFNNSGSEINLGEWSLVGKTKVFNFPKDTLIPNNKKIIFADDITGINDEVVRLENPLGKNYAELINPEPAVLGASINTEEISKEIEKTKEKLSQIQIEVNTNNNIVPVGKISYSESKNISLEVKDEKKEDVVKNENVVFEASKSKGFINTIFAWPIAGVDLIRGWFR